MLAVFLICALSGAGAILLIVEMEEPFAGMLQIPKTSLLRTQEHLGLAP